MYVLMTVMGVDECESGRKRGFKATIEKERNSFLSLGRETLSSEKKSRRTERERERERELFEIGLIV